MPHLKKTCSILFIVLLLWGSLSVRAANSRSDQVVRVGFPIQSGTSYIDEHGNYAGYLVDYLHQLTMFTHWEIEYVQVEGDLNAQLETLMDMLQRGEIDMLGTMNENDMYFVRVEISEAGVKAYVLENLMCQGTPQDITSSMEAGYLQEAVRELFSRGIERGTLKVSGDEYISFSPEID